MYRVLVVSGLILFFACHGISWDRGLAAGDSFRKDAADAARDYARARKLMPWNASGLLSMLDVQPHWIDGTDRFWYLRRTSEGKTFFVVDSATKARQLAFDHGNLASALSAELDSTILPTVLPFDRFTLEENGRFVEFRIGGQRWRFDTDTNACHKSPRSETSGPASRAGESRSPDGRWAAYVEEHDLFLRAVDGDARIRLTSDGEPERPYATPFPDGETMVRQGTTEPAFQPSVFWSPSGRFFVTTRLDLSQCPKMHLLHSVATREGYRPKLYSFPYAIAGDETVPLAEVLVVDLESKSLNSLAVEPLEITTREGSPSFFWVDDQSFLFGTSTRGGKEFRIVLIDAGSGETRSVWRDSSSTGIRPQALLAYPLLQRREFIFSSERDGWRHLYLVDLESGRIKRQITRGEFAIDEIVATGEDGWLYITASGKEPERDPYLKHFYRVHVDGGEMTLLTPEPADHEIRLSPTMTYFIDTYSTVDTAPRTVLRRTVDGALVMPLEQANIDGVLEAGYRPPLPFTAKARDGKTDLYGALYLPAALDSSMSYPIIDYIYTGPHRFHTPKNFTRAFYNVPPTYAALGFVVVTLDGLGSDGRGRAFREFSHGNLGDAQLEDHLAVLRQLAARHPFLDLDRVGIFGHSSGGHAAVRGMLKHPEFFKVGVSVAGNHFLPLDSAQWAELYMGYPVGDEYVRQSNDADVESLRGKLLVIHGELDATVHPASSLRLVDALVRANKDFDMLLIPGADHGFGHPYVVRRAMDYFYRHLLGGEPPEGFSVRGGG